MSDVQLASYRWHNMEDHTMEFFAPFITFCCGVVAKERIIMTSGVWNNLKEHLLKALLPVDIGLCYPLLLNRTWWTLSILLRAAERSQMDGTTKRQLKISNLANSAEDPVKKNLHLYWVGKGVQVTQSLVRFSSATGPIVEELEFLFSSRRTLTCCNIFFWAISVSHWSNYNFCCGIRLQRWKHGFEQKKLTWRVWSESPQFLRDATAASLAWKSYKNH